MAPLQPKSPNLSDPRNVKSLSSDKDISGSCDNTNSAQLFGSGVEMEALITSPNRLHRFPRYTSGEDEQFPHLDGIDGDIKKRGWWRKFEAWLYPPDQPRAVQLLRLENLAVPMCYLAVGLMKGLSFPLLNVYPLELHCTEAQQVTLATLCDLPTTCKIVFGFLSDNVPLFGYRRKIYMSLGWFIAIMSMVTLLASSDLTMKYAVTEDGGDMDKTRSIPPVGAPSVQMLSLCFLLFGTGFWLADVMADSIVAEKAKLEPPSSRGHLQSTCYAFRFFGQLVAAPCSTVLYSVCGPASVVICLAAIPVVNLGFIYFLNEERNIDIKRTIDQCREIWKTVCSRAVWQPMAFVYMYNILQVTNGAWRQFLQSVLGFTAAQLNALVVAAYGLLYFGTLAYKYYFIKWSWRRVYQVGILLNGVLSALQILLILGRTFGLSPFLFALGDDAFAELVVGIQFLPITIMMVHLCPHGSEGASYAMFTTVWNSALMLSPAISTLLLGIWDVSKETMESGDLSGLLKLTILTTVIQTSAVLFVKLLPETREDLYRLNACAYSGSKIGGGVFLSVLFSSIFYSTFVGVMNVVKPGWAGET